MAVTVAPSLCPSGGCRRGLIGPSGGSGSSILTGPGVHGVGCGRRGSGGGGGHGIVMRRATVRPVVARPLAAGVPVVRTAATATEVVVVVVVVTAATGVAASAVASPASLGSPAVRVSAKPASSSEPLGPVIVEIPCMLLDPGSGNTSNERQNEGLLAHHSD
ncbi:hypothetical protein PG985_006323 [Apiospora marii]|uniref:Uncharacterized protein n=1 Tax=Apiospora marii TaxID=335849 RepID=A0ABR1S7A2_9PEZI